MLSLYYDARKLGEIFLVLPWNYRIIKLCRLLGRTFSSHCDFTLGRLKLITYSNRLRQNGRLCHQISIQFVKIESHLFWVLICGENYHLLIILLSRRLLDALGNIVEQLLVSHASSRRISERIVRVHDLVLI